MILNFCDGLWKDPTMLKYAWAEFVEKEKAVTVEKLAEVQLVQI